MDTSFFYISYKLTGKIEKTPEGFMVCRSVPIMAAGEYPDAGGSRVVVLDEKDLFNESTIGSFEGKPFTIDHPPTDENGDMVNSENWAKYSHGHLDHVRAGTGEHAHCLVADVYVQTKDGQDRILGEGVEQWTDVSAGFYSSTVERADGKFDLKAILGNHVALVPVGRAGEQCSIQFSIKQGEQEMTKTYEEGLIAGISNALSHMFKGKKMEDDGDDEAEADMMKRMAKMEKRMEKMEAEYAEKMKADEEKMEADEEEMEDEKVEAKKAKKAKADEEKMKADMMSVIQSVNQETLSKFTGGRDVQNMSATEIQVLGSAIKAHNELTAEKDKSLFRFGGTDNGSNNNVIQFKVVTK